MSLLINMFKRLFNIGKHKDVKVSFAAVAAVYYLKSLGLDLRGSTLYGANLNNLRFNTSNLDKENINNHGSDVPS